MIFSIADCEVNPLKPNHSNLKSTNNYTKCIGLKKYARQKSNLTSHRYKVCNKNFKIEMMMEFHKQNHLHNLPSKDCEVNLNDGVNLNTGIILKIKPESRNKIQLQNHCQIGEQTIDTF